MGGGESSPCDSLWWGFFDQPSAPYLGPANVDEPQAARGSIFSLCVMGFRFEEPIDITIQLPDGSTRTTTATITRNTWNADGDEYRHFFQHYQDTESDPLGGDTLRGFESSPDDGTSKLRWLIPPDYDIGTYVFAAEQGDIQTTSSVEVVLPESQYIVPFDENYAQWGHPYENQQGDVLRYAFTGFANHDHIPLAIYRARDPNVSPVWDLYTELEPLPVGPGGSAVLELPLDDRFEPGATYCLDTPLVSEHSCLSTQLMFTVAG